MYPLVHVPVLGWTIPSYQALYLLAGTFSVVVGPRWIGLLADLDHERTRRAAAVLLVVAFAGGRLHFVATNWPLFAGRPLAALAFWSGGRHAAGALAMLVVAAPLVLRHYGLPAGRYADAGVPTVAVAVALARLGCFLHGCCAGAPARWPWCVTFPRWTALYARHASLGLIAPDAARSAPVHPLQLYFAAAALLVGGLALWLHGRKRYDWQVVLVTLTVHSALAAALEPLRADYPGRIYWGSLPQLTWTALALMAAAGTVLAGAELARAVRATPRLSRPS